jgi:hypothetical protein
MSLMTILTVAENGSYFDNAARACGVSTRVAKSSLERFCPAIAVQLKSKAQIDKEAFESLLDLLDEGDRSSELDNLTDSEAIADGKAVLEEIYGSPVNALAEMKRILPAMDDSAVEKISAIAATSVLAVLAKSYSVPATLAAVSDPALQSGGILQTIISAVLKGILQGVARQLTPRRRRRRSYSGYFGTRRRKTTRRKTRARTPTLEDIFGQILGTRKG